MLLQVTNDFFFFFFFLGITLDELQAALKLSARGKKPGSDGLPYEFYSQFWEVLGPELLAVLQDAF